MLGVWRNGSGVWESEMEMSKLFTTRRGHEMLESVTEPGPLCVKLISTQPRHRREWQWYLCVEAI